MDIYTEILGMLEKASAEQRDLVWRFLREMLRA